MNNTDLAEKIAAEQGITKADARKIVDAVFAGIGEAAAKGEEIALNGFGKFKIKESPARDGRKPATGEPKPIKASKSEARRSGQGCDSTCTTRGSEGPEKNKKKQ